jgi:predicted nucleic-acid-binding protein
MSSDSSSDSKSLFDVFKKDNLISSSTSQITNAFNNNSTLYIGLFVVIIFTIIIAVLLYTYLGWKLFSIIEQTVHDTKIPIIGTKLSKIVAEIADTANGARRSFTFWIYINDMNKYSGQYKNVLSLSSDPNNFNPNLSSPHVFLDKNNNSMYIRFSNKNISNTDLCPNLNTNLKEYMKQGIFIKYIPLQRWVHIAIVCNTDSFNTSLYAYVDGDLVNTIHHDEEFILNKNNNDGDTTRTNLNSININMSGYLYVGSDNIHKCGPGFSGLISNFTSFNYELNQKDIYNSYNKGPINGLLAKLGLASYGVRSPIYKL